MAKKLETKDRTYLLSGDITPLTKSIASRDTAKRRLLYVDEAAKQTRALRYSRNQKSQFMDEQNEFAIIEPIIFNDGKLYVPASNFALQEFLALHPDNESNGGHVFYEYNPEKIAEDNIKSFNIELDALNAVRDMPFDKLKNLAYAMELPNADKLQSSELRHNMMLLAKNYPEDILDMMESPDDNVMAFAKRAVEENYVVVKFGKDLYFNLEDNKKRIVGISHGISPEQTLHDWMLATKPGAEFYLFLQSKFEVFED